MLNADMNSQVEVAFGVDYDWHREVPKEENLDVWVARQDFPLGLDEKAILLYQDRKVLGVGEFLQNAKRYEDLVLSVPWLMRVVRETSDLETTILWVHEKSFNDKAMGYFAADMHELGKDALAEEVRQMQNDVALLTVDYGDYWLVLPDRRMVLWRFRSDSGLMGFKQCDFTVRQCTKYHGTTGGCVGAVVTPEGRLVR